MNYDLSDFPMDVDGGPWITALTVSVRCNAQKATSVCCHRVHFTYSDNRPPFFKDVDARIIAGFYRHSKKNIDPHFKGYLNTWLDRVDITDQFVKPAVPICCKNF